VVAVCLHFSIVPRSGEKKEGGGVLGEGKRKNLCRIYLPLYILLGGGGGNLKEKKGTRLC